MTANFIINVLYQNTFLLFDPGSVLERDNGPGVEGPWTVPYRGYVTTGAELSKSNRPAPLFVCVSEAGAVVAAAAVVAVVAARAAPAAAPAPALAAAPAPAPAPAVAPVVAPAVAPAAAVAAVAAATAAAGPRRAAV